MIIYHAGLAGSGKSYEAVVNNIIPALKKGRKVFSNIEGLNHKQFSDVTGIPLPIINNLLIQLDNSQIPTIEQHVENDSLVVIDELQDFFQSGNSKLSKGMTEFVTQHRHRGIDILAMGQTHEDVHVLWKRRIDLLFVFTKRDAVGMPNSYTWRSFKQDITAKKFILINSGGGSYDKKYFGLYKSHSDGTQNLQTHTDDRGNILKSKIFTTWLPLFVVILGFSIYYLYGFFHGEGLAPKPKPVQVQDATPPVRHGMDLQEIRPAAQQSQQLQQPQQPQPPPVERTQEAWLQSKLEKYRPRLVGLIESKTRLVAWVEFVDDSNRVYERFNIPQLQAFGYSVERKPYGLLLGRQGKVYPVTAFPLDHSRGVTTANGASRAPAIQPIASVGFH